MNAPVSLKVPYVIDVVDVDGEAAVVLPAAVLKRLGVKLGDTIDVVDDGDDSVSIRRHLSERDRQAAIADEVMRRRRRALSELAR